MAHKAPSSWDRLQAMLESLTPGDEIHISAAAKQCGLSSATCESVLDTLARMQLFTRQGDHVFIRRRMIDISAMTRQF
jgi:DNA-binding IclR family transcriptional regulator